MINWAGSVENVKINVDLGQRLSGSSNSNSSGIASILDDYNPEVIFLSNRSPLQTYIDTCLLQDLEKSSIVAVAWVVVIIVVTFFSTVNSRLLLLSVFSFSSGVGHHPLPGAHPRWLPGPAYSIRLLQGGWPTMAWGGGSFEIFSGDAQ